MITRSYNALLFPAALTLAGCQTATTMPPQNENIRTMQAEIDSDGDGVLDDIDECPDTPPNVVVDAKGCQIIIEGGEALEMELRGFFAPLSSRLINTYDKEFAKIEEKLKEYPDANVFIFGHVASNELAITPNKNNLSRNRAINIRNRLVEKHHITSDRISTYDCSDRYPFIATDFSESDLAGIESKDRRVTVKASTQVNDLANIENPSDWKNYEPYLKRCEIFKSE